jgi:hypothetical protein
VTDFVERPDGRPHRGSLIAKYIPDILRTETNGLSLRIKPEGVPLYKIIDAIRHAMRRRGLLVTITKDGDDALKVWVRGRRA